MTHLYLWYLRQSVCVYVCVKECTKPPNTHTHTQTHTLPMLSAPLSRVNLQCLSYLGRWVKAGRASSGATHTLIPSPSIFSSFAPLVYHVWETWEGVEIKTSLGKRQSDRMDSLVPRPASPDSILNFSGGGGGIVGTTVGDSLTQIYWFTGPNTLINISVVNVWYDAGEWFHI